MSEPASLEVMDLVKHFPVRGGLLQRRKGVVKAVDGVSFSIRRAETLGLVGESGCGKTTVSRMVLKLIEPTAGRILLGGVDVTDLSPAECGGIGVTSRSYSRTLIRRSIRVFPPARSSANRLRTSASRRGASGRSEWRTCSPASGCGRRV